MIEKPRRQKNNLHFKALYSIIFTILILSLAQISLISSAEFDNTKNFDSKIGDYGKIEIKDWFGLLKLEDIELKSSSGYCIDDCEAISNITMHQKGKLVDDVRFMTLNNKKTDIESYTFEYNDGKGWKPYNYEKVSSGNYQLRLNGELRPFQIVDWQIKSQGIWITEWAVWTSGLNQNITHYFKFDDGNGTVVKDEIGNQNGTMLASGTPSSVTGKIGSAFRFRGSGGGSGKHQAINVTNTLTDLNRNFTVNMWINYTGQGTTSECFITSGVQGWGLCMGGAGGGNIGLDKVGAVQIFSNAVTFNESYQMWTLTVYANNTGTLWKNATTVHGSIANVGQTFSSTGTQTSIGEFLNGEIDEVGFWTRELTEAERIELYNGGDGLTFSNASITLNSPADSLSQVNRTVIFNCSASDESGLQNLSLIIDGQINETENSASNGTDQELTKMVFNLSLGSHTWNCNSSNNNSVTRLGTQRSFTINTFTENSQAFDNTTIEGNLERFEINLTMSTGFQIQTAEFLWNETSSNTFGTINAISGEANNYTIDVDYVIPNVNAIKNVTFLWQITSEDGTKSNSTANNVSVSALSLDNCSTNSVVVLNYSLKDEETQALLTTVNTTIDLDVNISSITGRNQILNFSQRYSNMTNAEVCLNINITNTSRYRLDATAFYEADTYAQEFHNIQNFTLRNSTIPNEIDLFDLPTSSTTQFLIIFKDASFLPVGDALIDITRQYVSEGVFKSVEVPKTDFSGQATGSFDTTGAIYTIIVKKEGEILATFDNVAVFCEDAVIGDCKLNLNSQVGTGDFPDWDLSEGVSYTISFNEPIRTVTATFTVNDGTSKTLNLNVTKYDRLGNNTMCTDSLVSSSGTLSCVIPNSFGNTTLLAELSVGSSPQVSIASRLFSISPDARQTFGNTGYIMVIILLITLPMLMISNKTGFILTIFVGLVFAGALLLFNKESFIGMTSSIMWFLIAGGIIIWRMREE